MSRLMPGIALFCLGGLAGILAGLVLGPSDPNANDLATGGSASRWLAKSLDEQLVLWQRYQAVSRRPDASAVWRRAAEFAALPPAERDLLRELGREIVRRIEVQPPARQRLLWSLHERARAEEVYRLLERQAPERLVELLRRVGGD